MRIALLSLATAVAASPMADYTSSRASRHAAVDHNLMDNFRFYAQHAAATYCNAEGRSPGDSIVCSTGECNDVMRNDAKILNTFYGRKTGIAGYLAVDDTRREVVFATRGSNNIRNFITDLFFFQRDCDFASGCRVHAGFSQSWDDISAAATSAITDSLRARPGYKLVITGHSLGGAVAALAGAYLRRAGIQGDVYTFGAPRVGNAVFANFVDSQSGGRFRMTHTDDPVPRLPPMFFGYRHSGPEYWLSNGDAKQISYRPSDIKICEGIASVACNAGTYGFDLPAHLHYLDDTAGCASSAMRWRRDDSLSDDLLEDRLTKWSQLDQGLIEKDISQ